MTQIWNIHGGVHPAENKHQSMQEPLGNVSLPAEIVLPLNQHLGAPAEPIVAVGELVLTGQLIAEPSGVFSAALHASTSGTVSAIEERPLAHPSGMRGMCIVISPDGKDKWTQLNPIDDYSKVEPRQLVEKIRMAGVAGMGGAGFPTAIKMSPRANQKIDTLILNGTECEPYITADDRLMRDRADQIVEGIKLLSYLLGNPARQLIGIENNKPEAIAALQVACANTNIEVVAFPTKYPSGGEKQLIQIVTGKEVPSGKIPADIGIVVQNVATAVAAWRAVQFGEPLISRITTLVGEALERQRNVEVRLGTPIGHLLKEHGFNHSKVSRLVMGGPMMGFTLESELVPVVKTTNCVLAPSQREMPLPAPEQACIRCGMCADACPASLLPQQLYWYARAEDHEKLDAYNLFDCIECGACSYVCPSSIPLVQYYRAAKGDIRQAQTDKIKSDRSRERFAFRQERLARAEAEKEAKRKQRAEAAAAAKAKIAQQASNTGNNIGADPVSRAQAQAQSQQPSDQDQTAKLERQLASVESRLVLAHQKLAGAETPEQAEKYRSAIKGAELKVKEAQQKLTTAKVNTTRADDPVAAAIARAQAKQAMPADQKLKAAIASLQQRIASAEEKLAQARSEQSATADALASGVEKLQQKLAQAKDELAQLPADNKTETTSPDSGDAAAAAIARAKAKAAATAAMSDEEKLHQQISSLLERLAKAQQKLATAIAENSEHVNALRTGVDKLQSKLEQTKAKLENA